MTIYKKENVIVSVDEESGTILSTAKLNSSDKTDVSLSIDSDEANFLKNEFDVDLPFGKEMKADIETINTLLEMCFEVESEESKTDGELSARGRIAVALVNKLAFAS